MVTNMEIGYNALKCSSKRLQFEARCEKSLRSSISYAEITSRHGESLGYGDPPLPKFKYPSFPLKRKQRGFRLPPPHLCPLVRKGITFVCVRGRVHALGKWCAAYGKELDNGFTVVGGEQAFRRLFIRNRRPVKQVKPRVLQTKRDKPRPAVATSKKQVKVRHTIKTYKSDMAQEASYWYPIPPRRRDPALVLKLRAAILARTIKRVTQYRAISLEYYLAIALPRVEGWFDNTLDTIFNRVGDKIDEVGKSIVKDVEDKVKDGTNSLVKTAGIVLPTIITAAAGNSMQSWLTGCISVLIQIGILQQSAFKEVLDGFTSAANTKSTQPGNSGLSASAEGPGYHPPESSADEGAIRAVTLVWQAIAVFIGVKSDINKHDKLDIAHTTHTFMKEMRSAAMGTNGFLNMFKNFWEVVKSGYTWCYKKVTGGTSAEVVALWESLPAIEAACKEANDLLARQIIEFMNPTLLHRLAVLSTSMDRIVIELLTLKHNEVVLTNYFITLQSALRNKLIACKRAGYNVLTRMTPFVVYMVGEPGLGKSELTSRLAASLLQMANIVPDDVGPIYNKNSSSQYWDGYNCQPVVVFDDFMQVKMTTPEHSDEACLIQLKSSSIFRPPMAAVEDKGRIAAPPIVICLANSAYPQSAHLSSQDALWRRRDLMWQVSLARGKRVPGPCDPIDPSFSHLTFSKYSDARVPDSGVTGHFTFMDMVKDTCNTFHSYHVREKALCAERERAISEALKTVNADRTFGGISYEHIEQLCGRINALDTASFTPTIMTRVVSMRDKARDACKKTFMKYFNKKPASTEELIDEVVLGTQAITREMQIASVREHDLDLLVRNDTYHDCPSEMQESIKLRWELERPNIPWPHPAAPAEGPDPKPSTSTKDADSPPEEPQKVIPSISNHEQECTAFIEKLNSLPVGSVAYYDFLKTSPMLLRYNYNGPETKPLTAYESAKDRKLTLADCCNAGHPLEKPITCNVANYVDKALSITVECDSITPEKEAKFPYTSRLYKDLKNHISTLEDQWRLYKEIASVRKCAHMDCDWSNQLVYPHTPILVEMKAMNDSGVMASASVPLVACAEDCVLRNPRIVWRMQQNWIQLCTLFRRCKSYVLSHPKDKIVIKYALSEDRLARAVTIPTVPEFKSFVKKMASKCVSALKTAGRWLWRILKWIGIYVLPIICLFGIGYAGAKTVKYFRSEHEDGSERVPFRKFMSSEIATDYTAVYDRFGRRYVPECEASAYGTGEVKRLHAPHTMSVTMEANDFEDRISIATLKRNSAFLDICGRDALTGVDVAAPYRIFGICGNWFLAPRHYLYQMSKLDKDTTTGILRFNDTETVINPNNLYYRRFHDSEFLLLMIPKIPPVRDIRKHMKTDADWSNVFDRHMRIVEIENNGSYSQYFVDGALYRDFTVLVDDEQSLTIPRAIQYRWHGKGRCMSLVFDNRGFIIGFHIAGAGGVGYAEPVARETFDALTSVALSDASEYVTNIEKPKAVVESQMEVIGTVSKSYTINASSETSIRPSIIHGVFPVRTVPAPFKLDLDGQRIDQLSAGVAHRGEPGLSFDRDDIDVARLRFIDHIISHVTPLWSSPQVRSEYLAINGVESTPCFGSLDLSKSEGFPYQCMRPPGGKDKSWLLQLGVAEPIRSRVLRDHLDHNLALRKSGHCATSIFVDCLKDARLPLEKAYTPGKVRIFSVAPTDFLIHYRQYFADFIVSYVHAREQAHHAIGMSPESEDWTNMLRHLSVVGNKFLCGDYKNFGPGFDVECHRIANEVMRLWYRQYGDADLDDDLVRECLHRELEYPLHLARNVVYRTICGMPSGSPVTTVTNSMVNDIYIFTAWYGIMKKSQPRLATVDAMEKHLRYVTFGDDLLMCVSDEVCEIFNNETLQSWFAKYGVVYTDGTKVAGRITKYCSINEITFLKRSVVPHPVWPRLLLSGIDKVSIEDAANWINRRSPRIELSQQGTYACLMLAYGHGREYFTFVRRKLLDAWREIGYPITLRSWDDIDRMYFPQCYNILNDFEIKCMRECKTVLSADAEGPGVEDSAVDNTICDEHVDTILQEHVAPIESCPASFVRRMEQWCGADYDESFERLVNRQVILGTQKWSTSDENGKILKTNGVEARYNLPKDIIAAFSQTPSALPFLQYRYMRADMNVRVSVNANKFMNGQLQVSWYYAHNLDAKYSDMRSTLETRSQLLGGVIDAGSSNSVDICIPYKNYRPWIHVASRNDMEPAAILGELQIKVLSRLYAASTSANTCDVSIFCSFKNARFMGLVSRDLNIFGPSADGEMFPMMASYAAVQLFNKYADPNRDKTPLVSPAMPMTPLTTSSMAVGTGCGEPVLPLRLDARGMVPHPDGLDTIYTFTELASQKALVNRFKWGVNSDISRPLVTIQGEPLVRIGDGTAQKSGSDFYTSEKILETPAIYAYRIPPVGVVSDLFSYWRGSLSFEFHVVGSQYHTGRLLCAYIPHYVGSVTRAQAQAGPYVIFDIHEQRVFTFDTPYIADKPWWPVQGANGEEEDVILDAPGFLVIFILNPLIIMTSIADELDILIYMKAGPGFELAVPRQPSLTLGWNALRYDPQYVYANPGYAPYYPGGWRNFYGGKKSIMRYGPGSDHIAQFSWLEFGDAGKDGGWYYYVMTDDANAKVKHSFSWPGRSGTLAYTQLALVPFDANDGYGHIYLAVVAISEVRVGNRNCPFQKRYDGKLTPNYDGCIDVLDDNSPYCVLNPPLTRKLFPNSSIPVSDLSDLTLSADSEAPELHGMSAGIQCAPQPVVNSTTFGLETFGENFNDIKTYLRRYELIGRIHGNSRNVSSGDVVFSIPVLPQGYIANPSEDETIRYSRDGGHNIIASAFRFFRGSMNYKITIPQQITMWVQHRPDRHVEQSNLSKQTDNKFDVVMLKDYATTLNSSTNSPLLTINIPFYQPGSLGLLQQPNTDAKLQARRAMSLGELAGGFVPDPAIANMYKDKPCVISLYNAIGDDMRYLTYIGFPPMCRILDVATK